MQDLTITRVDFDQMVEDYCNGASSVSVDKIPKRDLEFLELESIARLEGTFEDLNDPSVFSIPDTYDQYLNQCYNRAFLGRRATVFNLRGLKYLSRRLAELDEAIGSKMPCPIDLQYKVDLTGELDLAPDPRTEVLYSDWYLGRHGWWNIETCGPSIFNLFGTTPTKLFGASPMFAIKGIGDFLQKSEILREIYCRFPRHGKISLAFVEGSFEVTVESDRTEEFVQDGVLVRLVEPRTA
jgi:hypothetical protein